MTVLVGVSHVERACHCACESMVLTCEPTLSDALCRYAENDRLKILELEDRKKIQHLLGLTQPVEYETTYFRGPKEPKMIASLAGGKAADPPSTSTAVQQKPPGKARRRRADGVPSGNGMEPSEELSDRERNETLLLTVEALKAQLEDHTRLANIKKAKEQNMTIKMRLLVVPTTPMQIRVVDITSLYRTVIPRSRAMLYSSSSTSTLTASVHWSRTANNGLW